MILLDTHVMIWWVNQSNKLSKKAKKAINTAIRKKGVLVSSISIWEVCILVKKNRLKLTMGVGSWIKQIEKLPFINWIPIDNNIAASSVLLNSNLHQDPADRIIMATALVHGAKIVTGDKRILKFKEIETIW